MKLQKLPKFKIVLDKKLDQEIFVDFFNDGNDFIKQIFPNIKTKAQVLETIENSYKDDKKDITNTVRFLNDNLLSLNKIALVISQLLDYGWKGINTITIIPAVCPICPRFIDNSSFMVAYYFNRNSILRICAHEMAHFVYFNKLRSLPLDKIINTEYPSKDWLISEIVAPLIVNSEQIQLIANDIDGISIPDGMITKNKIKKITDLFYKYPDIRIFREKALSEIGS